MGSQEGKQMDELQLETHFSFGENWSQYAEKINEARIEEAERCV